MYKTFEELERYAYMNNSTELAKLYAQLDDDERAEDQIERLYDKIYDLEMDSDYHQCNSEALEKKVEDLQKKLANIREVLDE